MTNPHSNPPWALVLLAAAVVAPTAFAVQWSPSGTALNSLTALVAWGLALVALAAGRAPRATWAGGLALALVTWAGFNAFVGVMQVFTHLSPSNLWLAVSPIASRATGNLRQPNLLGTVLLWGMVATVALAGCRGAPVSPASRRWGALLSGLVLLVLVGVLVLSASRTALFLGLPVLVLWGLFDRRLPWAQRGSLLALPLLALLALAALHWWGETAGRTVGTEARMAIDGMASVSRWRIWHDAWLLIQDNPAGVGWGGFNRAWTLMPVLERAPHFFDHPHNLFLQLIVELGWFVGGGLTLAILTAYAWGTWRAWRSPVDSDEEAVTRRAAWAIVTVVGLHSMMEYPLWYPYFLLPTLAATAVWLIPRSAWRWPPLMRNAVLVVGAAMVLLTALAAMEYRKVSAIYAPSADDGDSLVQRIAKGHQTFFFSRQADYAAATALGVHPLALEAAERASHVLIDTRLLIAWAKNLHAAGQTDKARYLVARLQEFHKPDGDAWMAECQGDPSLWHCTPPQGAYTWRDF